MIAPTTAQVLYRYDDAFYRDFAAVTCNSFGQGAAYYLGTTPDEATLTSLLHQAMKRAGLVPLSLPEGVESVVRKGQTRTLRFLINHNDHSVDTLGVSLEPFGVAILSF